MTPSSFLRVGRVGAGLVTAVCVFEAFSLLSSCGRTPDIIVGSKNFTEQVLLGEMAAQQLERKLHIKVKRQLNLGGTLLTHQALTHKQIDIYPEYTGTAVTSILKESAADNPVKVYMQVKDEYLRRYRLVWLPPLGFNDTFAMVVRREDAQKLTTPALSSAVSRPWRLGVGYEFLTRPDGMKRLDDLYKLQWQGTPQTMDLGILYQALGQHKIDMGAANSTDGLLDGKHFAVLSDDKRAFPPYNACFIIRDELAEQRPEVKLALLMLSGRIGDEAMRRLNRRVDVDHQPVVTVVKDFLETQP